MSIDGTMLTLNYVCFSPWSILKSVLVQQEIQLGKLMLSWLERSQIDNDILNYMWVSFSHLFVMMMKGLHFYMWCLT